MMMPVQFVVLLMRRPVCVQRVGLGRADEIVVGQAVAGRVGGPAQPCSGGSSTVRSGMVVFAVDHAGQRVHEGHGLVVVAEREVAHAGVSPCDAPVRQLRPAGRRWRHRPARARRAMQWLVRSVSAHAGRPRCASSWCDAHRGRRMRIVERRVQRVGRQGRRIVLVHLDQGRDQVARIAVAGGEGVRLELVLARA